MTLTDAQVAQLQALTMQLNTDQSTDDAAYVALATAQANATAAQTVLTQSQITASAADTVVATDLANLTAFIASLNTPVTKK